MVGGAGLISDYHSTFPWAVGRFHLYIGSGLPLTRLALPMAFEGRGTNKLWPEYLLQSKALSTSMSDGCACLYPTFMP